MKFRAIKEESPRTSVLEEVLHYGIAGDLSELFVV